VNGFPRTWLLACGLAPLLAGCMGFYPQRLPGPLVVPGEPGEGATESTPVPPASVTLQRNSDPVWVRRPGERGDLAVPYYEKRQRIPVGSLVRTGASGRAELLWTRDASSVTLFDEGRVSLGDPERDEPLLRFYSVTHAVLVLTAEDRVELLGGAVLRADPEEPAARFFLERQGEILRVLSQAKRVATVRYRSERLELSPGESLDLPVLPLGTEPRAPAGERLQGQGFEVSFLGSLERREEGPSLLLTARSPVQLFALGLEVQLAAEESVRFSGLTQVRPSTPADASVHP
jgi:hypothetical protein